MMVAQLYRFTKKSVNCTLKTGAFKLTLMLHLLPDYPPPPTYAGILSLLNIIPLSHTRLPSSFTQMKSVLNQFSHWKSLDELMPKGLFMIDKGLSAF